jgi:aminopeptidase N
MYLYRSQFLLRVTAATALLSAAFVTAPAQAMSAQIPTQLPRTVQPLKYDVQLEADAAALTFKGQVSILVDVLKPTAVITLNAVDLVFSSVSISSDALGAAPLVAIAATDTVNETATFRFNQKLPVGSYRLALTYTGKIGTQTSGLFALDYPTVSGQKRALYTQFENSDARRVIPCWDEPNYKAVFSLQAIVPADDYVLSNMPVVERSLLANGKALVRFDSSPKMSSYLLFFAEGDFERITTKEGATEIGVVTRKGVAAQGQFALDSAATILREYNDYFGAPYPLPKLDNIAAPGASQFFGAMENWGAIFTFERILLLDPMMATQSDTEAVFSVGAHEMAHQWFGDLVTMQWWDDIWLNEGFASWMASRTTDKLHPEWNTVLSSVGSREAAMSRDGVKTTHPVIQHITTVEQASQAFDSITYQKGQSVIHMLEGYVGDEAWRSGVQRYIKAHSYQNTTSDDLWNAMEQATGMPIKQIAHEFTLQPGIPLIRVDSATCVAGQTQLVMTQSEFTTDQPKKPSLFWSVPVIAQAVVAGPTARTVVTGGRGALSVTGCGPVVVNAGQSGYYRTLYSPAHFDALKGAFAQIAPVDQLGLLADRWAFGFNGQEPVTDYLDLVRATPTSAVAPVWALIVGDMLSLDDDYQGNVTRQHAFRQFALQRLAPVFAQVGWSAQAGEPTSVVKLRSSLIAALSQLGDEAVIAEARRRYHAQATDLTAVPGPLRKTILRVVATHASVAEWDDLHAAAIAEKTPMMQEFLFVALALATDPQLAQKALDLALTTEPSATTGASMIGVVAMKHPDMAFDFAYQHMEAVLSKVDTSSRSRYFAGLVGHSADPVLATKVSAYARDHLALGSRREATAAAESILLRKKLCDTVLPQVDQWLAKAL